MTKTLTHDTLRAFCATSHSLKDKVILVTGAGDGIGRAVALAYAQAGATVLLLGKNLNKLETLYDEIEGQQLATPAIVQMDLKTANFDSMQAIAQLVHQEFGRLDGILHNAGILGALTPLSMYDPITFHEVMTINAHAPFMLTQALLPLLQVGPSASVVFTTSGASHPKPRAFWGAYALSKQMLEGMSEIFTQETQHHTNLRFNCINPGATRTNMRAHAFPGEDPNTLKTPEEILNVYLALMSDISIDVKGQIIDCQPKTPQHKQKT